MHANTYFPYNCFPLGIDRHERDMMHVIAAAEKNRVSINEETLRKKYHTESEDVSFK